MSIVAGIRRVILATHVFNRVFAVSDDLIPLSTEQRLTDWLSRPNRDPQLVRAIQNRDRDPATALRALLESQLAHEDVDDDVYAICWIAEEIVPWLFQVLADDARPEARKIAVRGLATLRENPSIIWTLVQVLSDSDDRVVQQAIEALCGGCHMPWDDNPSDEWRGPAIIPAVMPLSNSPNVRVRVAAAVVLSYGRSSSSAVTQALSEGLAHPDKTIQRRAARAAYWGHNAAVPGLVGAMQNQDPWVRFWSAAVCAHTGLGDVTQVTSILLRSLQYDRELGDTPCDQPALEDAIIALGVAAVPALISQLDNTEIAERVSYLLWYRIGKSALPGMLAAPVDNPELRSNRWFVETLAIMDGDKHIQDALDSDLIGVRRAGVDVLNSRFAWRDRFNEMCLSLRRAAAKETNDQLLELIITGMSYREAGVHELCLMAEQEPDLRLRLAAVRGLGQAQSSPSFDISGCRDTGLMATGSLMSIVRNWEGEYHPLVVEAANALLRDSSP